MLGRTRIEAIVIKTGGPVNLRECDKGAAQRFSTTGP
jgi:hypothetical protein